MILRLYGINAPELHKPGGQEAKSFLANLVDGKQVTLRTLKDKQEKYGRYLGLLLLPNGPAPGANVNQMMVEAGHAVPYFP